MTKQSEFTMVRYVQKFGNVAVVNVDDDLKLIQSVYVTVAIGEEFSIPTEILFRGVDYGIDWTVIYPTGLHIEPDNIQKSFYAHGIFTIEDITKDPNRVIAAINSILKLTAIKIISDTKEMLGG
jgi:hypothetical protein